MKLKLVPIAVMGAALAAGVWMSASRWSKTAADAAVVFHGKRACGGSASAEHDSAVSHSVSGKWFSDAPADAPALTETDTTTMMSEIIAELKRMIEDDDQDGVSKALAGKKAVFAALISSESGKALARDAIAAMSSSSAGGPGIVAAVQAAADAGDTEFTEAAVEALEDALANPALSDREKSALIVDAEKVVTDTDLLDSLNMEILGWMRPSVQAETLKVVLAEGTREAKAQIVDAVDFVTDSTDCSSAAIDAWKAANPDDPGDEEFYGGEREE